MGHHDQVIAALREAPFGVSGWTTALNGVARLCGASSAQLLSFGQCRFAPVVAPGFSAEEIGHFVALDGADPAVNHGLRAAQHLSQHGMVSDVEYLSDDERRRDILYNDFFRRYDGDHIASAIVARNPDAICNINLFFTERTGGIDQDGRRALRRILPHFTEALRLTTRLEGMAAALASGVWDRMGQAALLCDAAGRIVHANREAEEMLARDAPLRVRHGRLASRNATLPMRLGDAIRAAADPVAPRAQSLIARSAGHAMLVLDVIPLSAMSSLLSPPVLVLARNRAADARLDDDLLEAAFGLTPAERAVAAGLMQRLSSADIARMRGVSIETVNSQVKAVLAKTGCANRGEVTSALQGFATLRPGRD